MATLASPHIVEVLRTREDCPYSAACPYRQSCRYRGPRHFLGVSLKDLERAAMVSGRAALGTLCLTVGLAMSLTLFLIPIGIPLALVGVALLASSAEPIHQ